MTILVTYSILQALYNANIMVRILLDKKIKTQQSFAERRSFMSFMDNTADQNLLFDANTTGGGQRLPLARASKGETYKVVKISGKDETKKHLSDLGFVLNSEVTVVNEVQGNLICEVKGVRVALSHELAQRITVIS